MTIGHDVPDVSDDDEDNEPVEMHTQEVTTQIEVSQADEITLQQVRIIFIRYRVLKHLVFNLFKYSSTGTFSSIKLWNIQVVYDAPYFAFM